MIPIIVGWTFYEFPKPHLQKQRVRRPRKIPAWIIVVAGVGWSLAAWLLLTK